MVFAFFVNPFQGQNYLISANIFVDISQQIFSEFVQNAIGVNLCSVSEIKLYGMSEALELERVPFHSTGLFFVERVL
jgi:hypothetical protein